VAEGEGHFVAGGKLVNGSQESRLILSSPDGIAWTDTSSGTGPAGGTSLPVLGYLHNRFVGSAVSGEIVYSLDHGASFTGTGLKSWDIQDCAYNGGIFFACGNRRNQPSAQVNLASVDGVGWSELPTPAQQKRFNVTHFNGRLYTSGSNGSIWRSELIEPAAALGYLGWQTVHFSGMPPLSGPDDDFDGDGVPNLGEYVTGTDPRDGADSVAIQSLLNDGFLLVSVPKTAGAEDAVCHAEYSQDLEAWSESGFEIVEDSPERLRVRVPITTGSGFLRVVFALD
jgi:hypothetical protein